MPIIASRGTTVAVSQFKIYSIIEDDYIVSRRYAISTTIAHIHGVRIGPLVEIPIADVDDDGFTEIGYSLPSNQ
ncbi:hypothetical protein [Janthinobacterium sp. HH106]|uniref:hypothetical protein n=1 Tax=Janthinobacterium sp. HH106 TaxID=1537278 RepID=UPI001113075D|nr:hypothetical protein [Janthinobacterium sp. HH106]